MNDELDIKQAAALAGVSVKTIRRYLADGRLTATVVRGRRGDEYRFSRSEVLQFVQGAPMPAKPTVRSPLEDVRTELEELRFLVAEQSKQFAERERLLLDNIDAQRQTIDSLRAEVRDSRGQLAQLHEHVLKALPAPKKPWWKLK